jgi:hypothetical protein
MHRKLCSDPFVGRLANSWQIARQIWNSGRERPRPLSRTPRQAKGGVGDYSKYLAAPFPKSLGPICKCSALISTTIFGPETKPQAQWDIRVQMRFLPNILRTIYAFTVTTLRAPLPLQYKAAAQFSRSRALESMPAIPLLGSLFSSSSGSKDMSYPVQKSDDEWRAVLSKGR